MNESKLKVIILYNRLFHYRIPVWNILAEKCDLTVAYTEGDGFIPEGLECHFKVLHLPAYILFKRIVLQKCNIIRLANDYDVALTYGGVTWLKYSLLPFFHKHVAFHTLGVSASYETKYDSSKKWDFVQKVMFSKAKAVAFYTQYPIEKYAKMGVQREKMFEAPNTVAVKPINCEIEKDSILFIGTLYKQKGIQSLLEVYKDLDGKCNLPILNIIGKGPEFAEIETWINNNSLSDKIKLRGAVYNIEEKAKYFARALACISPQQAGLSVLESMGYGVPYVTTKDAFTGGEIFNIHDGIDGVLMSDISELLSIIRDISTNKSKYLHMGAKAMEFYNNDRKPSDMADGLWKAICYAYNN